MPNMPLTEAYKILLLVWNTVSNSELMGANKLSYILVIVNFAWALNLKAHIGKKKNPWLGLDRAGYEIRLW